MEDFEHYLKENAKFLSPTPGVEPLAFKPETYTSGNSDNPVSTPNPTQKSKSKLSKSEKSSGSSTDVSDVEAKLLDKVWKPVAGWRDTEMVDSLCNALDTYLQQRFAKLDQEGKLKLQTCFTPVVDCYGLKVAWKYNNSEADVSS